MGLVHAENPGVADRRPKNIARQVASTALLPWPYCLQKDTHWHCQTLPGRCENGWAAGLQGRAEERGDLAGKDSYRHEELPSSRLPVLAIGSDPTAGDQQVHMGVKPQLAIPGVEHRQDARQSPEVPFLGTKVLDRRGCDLHEQAAEQFLIATERRAQLRRHSHDSVKIVAGQ